MLNSNELTTDLGAKIVFVYEDESIRPEFESNLDRLQDTLRAMITNSLKDTGEGTKVYVLINADYEDRILTESGYEQWQIAKDWGHKQQSATQFAGPTPADFEAYLDNETAIDISNEDDDCRFCLVPTFACPFRDASFNKVAFDAEIARRKALLN